MNDSAARHSTSPESALPDRIEALSSRPGGVVLDCAPPLNEVGVGGLGEKAAAALAGKEASASEREAPSLGSQAASTRGTLDGYVLGSSLIVSDSPAAPSGDGKKRKKKAKPGKINIDVVWAGSGGPGEKGLPEVAVRFPSVGMIAGGDEVDEEGARAVVKGSGGRLNLTSGEWHFPLGSYGAVVGGLAVGLLRTFAREEGAIP